MKKSKGGEFAERDERLNAGNKLTAEEKLVIIEAENAKLRDRINKSIKYIPREVPDQYFFTASEALVEKLQVEGVPGKHKMRKAPIMPFHVTGSSQYEGKRFYFDIKDRGAIKNILTAEELKQFSVVDDIVPSEMNAKAKDLENKLAESAQAKKNISDAKDGVGEVPKNEEIE